MKAKPQRAAKPAAVEKKYFSRREVATYLGCSLQHVINLVRQGLLPEYDISPFAKRYRIEDVEAFMQSRRHQAALKKAA